MSKIDKCLANRGTYTYFTYKIDGLSTYSGSPYTGSHLSVRALSVKTVTKRLKTSWGDSRVSDVVITGSAPSNCRVFVSDCQ